MYFTWSQSSTQSIIMNRSTKMGLHLLYFIAERQLEQMVKIGSL